MLSLEQCQLLVFPASLMLECARVFQESIHKILERESDDALSHSVFESAIRSFSEFNNEVWRVQDMFRSSGYQVGGK